MRPVRLAENTITASDREDLTEWLQTDPWLTLGPLTEEFERRWSAWLGRKHALFVNSGSSANLLMVYVALLRGVPNRTIIVPAVSWATTVAPTIQLGLEPILCGADWPTFGLDIVELEELIKRHEPAAVIVVHVLGVPVDMASLLRLKAQYGFVLLEDTCAATGSTYDGRHVGTFGDLSSFSFFYGHHISTIEGGMVCTDDDALYDLLLQLRSHGWPKNLDPALEAMLAKRYDVLDFNRPFTFYSPGFNVRSTDLNARIGLSQMDRIDWIVRRRVENHAIYQARFQRSAPFSCQTNPRASICSISFAALAASSEHRENIAAELTKHSVETRPLGGGSMGRQPFWVERYGEHRSVVADRIHECSFLLPNHPGLSPQDIHDICDLVLAVKP